MLGDGDHGTTILKGFDKAVLAMDSISYKNSIDSTTQIILSTDNKYLKYLNKK